jgi:hypothetical protein
MSDKQKYKVGQWVWLYDRNGSRYDPGPFAVEVTKIGRSLVTVSHYGRPVQFRIEDGSWNDRNFGHQRYIRTDEEKATAERREQALDELRQLGVRWDLGGTERQYSVEQLEAVVAVLQP